MGFLDFLGGAAQGASQGFNTMLDLQQQQFQRAQQTAQLRLQQQQMEAQLLDQRRRAVEEARQYLNPGSAIDPSFYAQAKELGLHGGMEKDPVTGQIVLQASLPQQLTQAQLKNENMEMESKTTALALQKAQAAAQNALVQMNGKLYKLPVEDRLAMIGAATGKFEAQTPSEELKNSATLAAAQARAYAAAQPRPTTDYQQTQISLEVTDKARQAANQEISRLYPTGMKMPPGKADEIFQKYFQLYSQAAGQGPQSPAPSPGVRQQIGRFIVEQ